MDVAPEIASLSATVVADSAVTDRPGDIAGHRRAQEKVQRPARSRSRTFIICACVSVALLTAYNLAVRRVARTSQRQQLLAALSTIPSDTDVLFLGNSLVEAGCDVKTFLQASARSGASIQAANIALGATFPIEHCLILHRTFQRVRPKYVVYGFFDDELNCAPSAKFSDLVGNRALAYYFPDEAAELYSPGSALKKWELRICGMLPMISERSSLWGKVNTVREEFGAVGMPARKRNRFGFVQNFGALEASDVQEFQQRCIVAAEQNQFSLPVRKIIQMTQQQGAKLVLVEMPMPSRHRRMFYSTKEWTALRSKVQELAAKDHIQYISASDWITNDNDFMDVTHLNESGAREFSARLANDLVGKGLKQPN